MYREAQTVDGLREHDTADVFGERLYLLQEDTDIEPGGVMQKIVANFTGEFGDYERCENHGQGYHCETVDGFRTPSTVGRLDNGKVYNKTAGLWYSFPGFGENVTWLHGDIVTRTNKCIMTTLAAAGGCNCTTWPIKGDCRDCIWKLSDEKYLQAFEEAFQTPCEKVSSESAVPDALANNDRVVVV